MLLCLTSLYLHDNCTSQFLSFFHKTRKKNIAPYLILVVTSSLIPYTWPLEAKPKKNENLAFECVIGEVQNV